MLLCIFFIYLFKFPSAALLGLYQIVYSAGEHLMMFYHFVFCKVMTLNYYVLQNWELFIYYIQCSLFCVLSCFVVVNGNLDRILSCFLNSGTYLLFIVAQSSFIIFICEQKKISWLGLRGIYLLVS